MRWQGARKWGVAMSSRTWARHHLPALLLALVLMTTLWTTTTSAQTGRIPPWRISLPAPPIEEPITVGQSPLTVELALSPEQQSLGLGYRNGLVPGTGMLFVFDSPQVQTFWMKGMRFCLDIVWVTDGHIVGAAENACPDPEGIADADRPTYTSPEPVQYVLEIPGGWLQVHGYGAGTPVDLSAIPATPAASFAVPRL